MINIIIIIIIMCVYFSVVPQSFQISKTQIYRIPDKVLPNQSDGASLTLTN